VQTEYFQQGGEEEREWLGAGLGRRGGFSDKEGKINGEMKEGERDRGAASCH